MDYLVKNGASRCYTDARLEISVVRRLEDFSWSENGVEKGKQGIFINLLRSQISNFLLVRERATALAKLLADEKRVEWERENARKMKEKMKCKAPFYQTII